MAKVTTLSQGDCSGTSSDDSESEDGCIDSDISFDEFLSTTKMGGQR